jgi:tetratricopeptide (TPR) repeat protein
VEAQSVPSEIRQGFNQLQQGRVDAAIATFQDAVRRYPNSLEAKLGLGIAYRRAGRDADAWQTYQQVLQQDPNNLLALRTLGTLGGFRPEWQAKGIEALTRLLAIAPNDTEALAQRALLLSYQGRLAESIADYQVVLSRTQTPDILLAAAQVYTYTGDFARGLALFNQYRSATGRSITGNAVVAYSRALRGSGNPAEAVQVLQSQLPRQINALAIEMRSELSQAYLDNGQPAEALAILDPLRGRSDARLPLARALNEIGQRRQIASLLTEVASLYRQVLAETPNPSVSLVREAADVLSGIPQERPYALQLYRQLALQQPSDRTLALQQLGLETQLGLVSRADLRRRLQSVLRPLPPDPGQRAGLARGLLRIEPDAEFLPEYQALVLSVNEPFLNFRIAQMLIQRNDLAGAKTAIAVYKATPAGANDRASELLLAEVDRREGNLEASAQRYQALLSSGTGDADVQSGALRGLAGIRLAQGKADEALSLYDQLIARNPQDGSIQLARASIAYQTRRISLAEAEAVLNTWVQTRADTPPELYSLVAILPPDAKREPLYLALVQADPGNIPVQTRLIQTIAQRDLLAARVRANQLLAQARANFGRGDTPEYYFLQGQLAEAAGNLEVAGAAYQAVLAREPDNVDALSSLGGIRFQQRRFESAENLYVQVLELKPDDLVAQRSLADLTAAQGKPIEALQRFEQLQVQLSTNGTGDPAISRRMQEIKEDLLKQRGFQPSWERF